MTIAAATPNHYNKHKPLNNSDEVNKITNSTHTSKNTLTEPENSKECCNSDSSDSILNSSLDSE